MFSRCRESRQGGGVMVYVNSMFCATRVDEPGKDELVESLWLDVKVGGKDKIRIGAFYRADNLQNDSQAEVDHKICEEICMNFRPKCIIMGDFILLGYEKKMWRIPKNVNCSGTSLRKSYSCTSL